MAEPEEQPPDDDRGEDGGEERGRDSEEHRFTVDLLVRLLLDDLGPAVEAHRRALARRLDLEPVDLLCLDVVGRLGATPSSRGRSRRTRPSGPGGASATVATRPDDPRGLSICRGDRGRVLRWR